MVIKGVDMEIILCAAIWYKEIKPKKEISSDLLTPKNINSGLVFCGWRHPSCLYIMASVTGLRNCEAGENIQGFLTSKNRFVDRIEGAKIALSNGQIEKLHYSNELFSEDLY